MRALVACFILILSTAPAFAQCASPSQVAGAIEYFSSDSTHRICNGTDWEVIQFDGPLTACASDKEREYDSTEKAYKICDSANWQKVACVAGGGSNCTEEKETASDAGGNDFFGTSVAMSGDVAVIGAWGNSDNGSFSGSAYIFERNGTTWSETAKLLPSDGTANDRFGMGVAVSGDVAVIGADLDDDNGSSSGSAYVFERNGATWSQTAKLTAADGTANDRFGGSIAMSGNVAVIGADGDFNDAGSAYVFERNGAVWSQTAKLRASDSAAGDEFGESVAVSGDVAVIGAAKDDDDGSSSGSAYIFERNGATWSETAKLTASDAAAFDEFGGSVAVSGDIAVIGSEKSGSSGSAYVFERNGAAWSETAKLLPSDGTASDRFGKSVALFGDIAVIGNPTDDDNGSASGSAYIFERNGATWSEITKLTASDGAADDFFSASVAVSGSVAVIGANGDSDDGSASGSAYFVQLGLYDDTAVTEEKETASDGAANDEFGTSVAVSGDIAVFGAPFDDDDGNASGSAYVFERNGAVWSQTAKLTASDGAADDWFGNSVAISGDVAVFGAPFDDDGSNASGSAYVFERNGATWSQTAKLTASDGAALDFFGESVAVSGNVAVIGAYQDDDNGDASGSAYVFERNGASWSQTAKLTASDGAANDNFGRNQVAVSGDVAVIGAPGDADNGVDSGSAYVFERNGATWSETAKLTPLDGATEDDFGWSVAVSGNVAVIGARDDDDNGSNSGSAYVFERSGATWSEITKLTASDGAAGDSFGGSVAVSDNIAVIGARSGDDNGSNSGSAYIFERNGAVWSEVVKLIASDGAAFDFFGVSVAASGDVAVIGASDDDDNGTDSGSAYITNTNLDTACGASGCASLGVCSQEAALEYTSSAYRWCDGTDWRQIETAPPAPPPPPCTPLDQTENFGAGSGSFTDWINVTGDNHDWSLDNNDTPSTGVGPTSDQSGTGFYAYTEASSPVAASETFFLQSGVFPANCNIEVSFYYNKRGDFMGDLYLEKSVNGGAWTEIWNHLGTDVARSGTDVWRFVDSGVDADLAFSESETFELRFRAVMPSSGTVWHSDLGLDTIRVQAN